MIISLRRKFGQTLSMRRLWKKIAQVEEDLAEPEDAENREKT